jgi:hypothetical protein
MSHLVIRLYKPAKTRAIASAKIKTGKFAYEISTYLSAIETKYNNTLYEAEIFTYSIVKKYGKCVAVCESTANLWLKTYQAFVKMGFSNCPQRCEFSPLTPMDALIGLYKKWMNPASMEKE